MTKQIMLHVMSPLMVFAKSSFASYGLSLSDDKEEEEYDRIDADGNKYQLRDLRKRGNGDRREDRPNMHASDLLRSFHGSLFG